MKKIIIFITGCSLLILFANCSGIAGLDSDDSDSSSEVLKPNVLFIIADDLGVGETPGYPNGLKPHMPNLNDLIADGIIFDNAWAYPVCSPTRASILTGKHSFRTGVTDAQTNGLLSSSEVTIHKLMSTDNSEYSRAVFGKWHVSRSNVDGPSELGVNEYRGLLAGTAADYYSWDYTQNGSTATYDGYITEKISDVTIDWIRDQDDKPWFAWVAFTTPHTPFHVPPTGTHSQGVLSGLQDDIDANPQPYFFAMVENLDYEIGRILDSMSAEVRANTTVIFLGDNGSHKDIVQSPYLSQSSKGSLYQGGIHVPLIVSGYAAKRKNINDNSMISTTDIFSTLLDLMGVENSEVTDSLSFTPRLSSLSTIHARTHNYSEVTNTTLAKSGYTFRSTQYKLIHLDNGDKLFFDLIADPYELTDLDVDNLTAVHQVAYDSLVNDYNTLVSSSLDTTSDITNAILTNLSDDCSNYQGNYVSSVNDVFQSTSFAGQLAIAISSSKCIFTSNSIPNHDFNDGNKTFTNLAQEVASVIEIPLTPSLAGSNTALSIGTDNAVFLNGVKLDLLAAACYGIGSDPLGSEKIGCGNSTLPWRYDPMSSLNNFGTDTHNAHTQADGTYHYHGSPNALFLNNNSIESPVVGFAADGFPIFGSYINDNGVVREVLSGFTLKAGARVTQANEGAFPGGNYDGTYRDDYEYTSSGDLDECNGMLRNGSYGYYITNSYPWVMSCFKGTPDSSFDK